MANEVRLHQAVPAAGQPRSDRAGPSRSRFDHWASVYKGTALRQQRANRCLSRVIGIRRGGHAFHVAQWGPAPCSQAHEHFRLFSTCTVQIKKSSAPTIDIARGHTTRGARVNDVTRPAAEQNSSAPIAFRNPAFPRKARCPMAEAAKRAAMATNPRIRGPIMLFLTDRVRGRHAPGGKLTEDLAWQGEA